MTVSLADELRELVRDMVGEVMHTANDIEFTLGKNTSNISFQVEEWSPQDVKRWEGRIALDSWCVMSADNYLLISLEWDNGGES